MIHSAAIIDAVLIFFVIRVHLVLRWVGFS